MSTPPAISHVTIPAVTLPVLDAPVSIEHAKANLDEHGHFTGIVDLDVDDVFAPDTSYDTFYDRLAAALVEGIEPYNLCYEVLAVDAQHETAYVRISTDIVSYLDALGMADEDSDA